MVCAPWGGLCSVGCKQGVCTMVLCSVSCKQGVCTMVLCLVGCKQGVCTMWRFVFSGL